MHPRVRGRRGRGTYRLGRSITILNSRAASIRASKKSLAPVCHGIRSTSTVHGMRLCAGRSNLPLRNKAINRDDGRFRWLRCSRRSELPRCSGGRERHLPIASQRGRRSNRRRRTRSARRGPSINRRRGRCTKLPTWRSPLEAVRIASRTTWHPAERVRWASTSIGWRLNADRHG